MRRVFWLLMVLMIGVTGVGAQDDARNWYGRCLYTEGTYYEPQVIARYEAQNQRIVLVNWTTGETVYELENSVPPLGYEGFDVLEWSPDCRYVTVQLTPPGHFVDNQILVWDTTTGVRVHTFDNPYNRWSRQLYFYPEIVWNPWADTAILGTTNGLYLWHPSDDSTVLIPPCCNTPDWDHVYWDNLRHLAIIPSLSGVAGIDTQSNEVHFRLGGSGYIVSQDGTKIVTDSLSIYDIDTGTEIRLSGRPPQVNDAENHMALSPDNRYLVVGHDALRVWDLQNLPEKVEDRLPIYRHGGPETLIWSVRFAEPGVIETTSDEGVQKWDLHTGVYIP